MDYLRLVPRGSAPDHRQQHPGGHGGADNPRHIRAHRVHQQEIMVVGLQARPCSPHAPP